MALASLGAIATPSTASHVSSHADITVTWAANDMGFNASSSKDLSNIIVVPCTGANHKHEVEFSSGGITWFNHTETFVIYAIYVKSGNNGIPGNIPPGAGELFVNAGANCSAATTTPPATTTPGTSSTPVTTTSQIPFFPSATALALGIVGALGGAVLILRRRG